MTQITAYNTQVETLGEPTIDSPLNLSSTHGDGVSNFTPEQSRVRYQVELVPGRDEIMAESIFFEKAGPRSKVFFNPKKAKAAIVTCGGLCPGLNNVIRGTYFELIHSYGIKKVYGIQYGYKGLNPKNGLEPILLTTDMVEDIHSLGGTILGSSRGAEKPEIIVDFLEEKEIDMLFCIGGDGTLKGANAISDEVKRRDLSISIIGIPKTIDNDIKFVWKTFGFSTAVEEARHILTCAHTEAKGYPNGIGLVKVMGRHAGFIAAAATMASQDVNFVLVPEIPFDLKGENGFFNHLKKRLLKRGHAVVLVAEGAGQNLFSQEDQKTDPSGNPVLNDIGVFLKSKIIKHFEKEKMPVSLKYIDPSYIVRSVPANSDDSFFCNSLSRNAVHAAMAGKTNMVIGLWHNVFIHAPIPLVTKYKKTINPESMLWQGVLESTGQPDFMLNNKTKIKK